jgi:hypothetical protein
MLSSKESSLDELVEFSQNNVNDNRDQDHNPFPSNTTMFEHSCVNTKEKKSLVN